MSNFVVLSFLKLEDMDQWVKSFQRYKDMKNLMMMMMVTVTANSIY